MSLIHEALEKLEGEKNPLWKKPLPPEPVTLEKEPVRTPNATVIYGIAGALIFFFLTGLVYFFTLSKENEKLSPARPVIKESPAKRPALFKNFPARNQFTLSGITRVGTQWTAIVNNHLVRAGENVSGAEVLAIKEGEVILQFNGQRVRLSLHGDLH